MSNKHIRRIAVTAGEPSGIGPDLILALSCSRYDWQHQIVIIADKEMLSERAIQLDLNLAMIDYAPNLPPTEHQPGTLVVEHIGTQSPVVAGVLTTQNSNYVLKTLERATEGCISKEFDAVVTGPVHKGVINRSGVPFSGHTEFFADRSKVPLAVMMLVTEGLRVALATTHLPLSRVPQVITRERLERVIHFLHYDLVTRFGIKTPNIYVCGLNPHAGESGFLGTEEVETIIPTVDRLKSVHGYRLTGPLPADTIFSEKYLQEADVVLGMYHDQVTPVLKYKGFGQAVNVTLGLPFVRTSVDHGTALDLAGTGGIHTGSLEAALKQAVELIEHNDSTQGIHPPVW